MCRYRRDSGKTLGGETGELNVSPPFNRAVPATRLASAASRAEAGSALGTAGRRSRGS